MKLKPLSEATEAIIERCRRSADLCPGDAFEVFKYCMMVRGYEVPDDALVMAQRKVK